MTRMACPKGAQGATAIERRGLVYERAHNVSPDPFDGVCSGERPGHANWAATQRRSGVGYQADGEAGQPLSVFAPEGVAVATDPAITERPCVCRCLWSLRCLARAHSGRAIALDEAALQTNFSRSGRTM